jgi:hypothetical protein
VRVRSSSRLNFCLIEVCIYSYSSYKIHAVSVSRLHCPVPKRARVKTRANPVSRANLSGCYSGLGEVLPDYPE